MDPIAITKKDEQALIRLANQGPLGKRALYIFQYLFLRKDFHSLILDLRKQLELPQEGLDLSNPEHGKLFNEKYVDHGGFMRDFVQNPKIDLGGDVHVKIDRYLSSCGVVRYAPNMDWAEGFIIAIVKEYLLINSFVGIYKTSFGLIVVDNIGSSDLEDEREPIEFRISLPISVKKDEVQDYINSIWRHMDFAREEVMTPKDKVRFRPRKHFVRDLAILNKYLELEKLSKSQKRERGVEYLEITTKKELQAEGYKNIPDEGSIRSIVSRLKNEIKDKNSYWEEYEDFPDPDPNYKPSDNDDF